MNRETRWLLPDGVDELLPPEAAQAEHLRRTLLDQHAAWGYELVMPPFVEHLDALLTGTGGELDLQTFKVTDPQSGRLLGIRADMTPQAARIDAHQLRREGVTRLCYLGSTLHSRPDGLAASRNPVQLGAEVYGHPGFESDVEVIELMLAALQTAGLQSIHLDLGHVGVFRALVADAGLDGRTEHALFDALQRKATDEMAAVLSRAGVTGAPADRLVALARLHGGIDVLDTAGIELQGAGQPVDEALRDLWAIASSLERRQPGVPLHFDLGELRGYRYHTGAVFAAYQPGHGVAVARGGRYDGIGEAFGRPRPATGYSTDLRTLLRLGVQGAGPEPTGILAPWRDDLNLMKRVEALRSAGERVIWQLPGDPSDPACDRILVERGGSWEVEAR